MKSLVFTRNETNVAKLHEELAGALGAVLIGVSVAGDWVRVHVDVEEMTAELETQVQGLVVDHDETLLTADQEDQADADDARRDFGGMIRNRIQWHRDNPADANNAGQVLKRMQTEWVLMLRFMRREVQEN